jgi:hypothetical protein
MITVMPRSIDLLFARMRCAVEDGLAALIAKIKDGL